MDMVVHIVLDTNFYLHYKEPRSIDWPGFLGLESSDTFRILVPRSVAREVDKYKDSSQGKLKNRAMRIQRTWMKAIRTPDRVVDGIEWKFLKEPVDIDFRAEGLSEGTGDGHLVASCLSFVRAYEPDRLVVVTNDTALTITVSEFCNLEVYQPSELDRQPEDTAEQREIARLQRELAAIKNARPDIALLFPDQSKGSLELVIEAESPPWSTEQLSQVVEEELARYKVASSNPPPGDTDPLSRLAVIDMTEARERRKKKLEIYRSAYEEYCLAVQEYFAADRLRFEVVTEIYNCGTAIAEDIDVQITAPGGVTLLPESPPCPKPPEPPVATGVSSGFISYTGPSIPHVFQNIHGNVEPFTEIEEERVVQAHVGKVKHHTVVQLRPFWIQFNNESEVRAFAVEYLLNSRDLPTPVTGTLHFVPVHRRE